jgi:hypothetical protein
LTISAMPGTFVSPHSVPSAAIHVVCWRYFASGDLPSSSIHAGDCPIQRGANFIWAAVPQIVPASVGVATRNTASHLALRSRETCPATSFVPTVNFCVSATSKPSFSAAKSTPCCPASP